MNNINPSLTIIMPALNEEKNIVMAIDNTLQAFLDFDINGELIIINDGSRDSTERLVKEKMEKDERIRMLEHDTSKGIGASFWEGVDCAIGDTVCMLPGDNENNPREIFRYFKLLEHVDIIIPFVFNKEARSLFRNALSFIYRFIINTTFLVNFNYTNGTVLYRKSILKELEYRSTGFFFQTDILIRAAKKGYLFAEVPYRLNERKSGKSKAVTFPSFMQVIKGYLRVLRDMHFKQNIKLHNSFSSDSLTSKRRNKAERQ